MTDEDLKAAKALVTAHVADELDASVQRDWRGSVRAYHFAKLVPKLIAEIERLRAENARLHERLALASDRELHAGDPDWKGT